MLAHQRPSSARQSLPSAEVASGGASQAVRYVHQARQRAASASTVRPRTVAGAAAAPSRPAPRPPLPVRGRSLDEVVAALDARVQAWSAHFETAHASVSRLAEQLDALEQARARSAARGSLDDRQSRFLRELLQIVAERLYTANSHVQLSRTQTAIIGRLDSELADAARAQDKRQLARAAENAAAARAAAERAALVAELRAADERIDAAMRPRAEHDQVELGPALSAARSQLAALARERDAALSEAAALRSRLSAREEGDLARERDAALARVAQLESELARTHKERALEAVARYESEREVGDLRDELRRRSADGAPGAAEPFGPLRGRGLLSPPKLRASSARPSARVATNV